MPGLATRRIVRLIRQLTSVPDSYDPNGVVDHSVEEPVRGDWKLSMWEFRELGNLVTRVRLLAKLCDDRLCAPLDTCRSRGALGSDEA